MTTIRVELEGKEELERKLSKLSKAAATSIAKDAVDEGGAVVQFYAQLNARNVFSNRQRGQLRNSIRVESQTTISGAEAEIGPHVIYGRIHEFGGTIKPIRAKLLHWVTDGVDHFAKQVTIPARPYLGPAVEEHRDQIIQVMKDAVADGINDAI